MTTREIETDVLVVGAGASGIPAAIGAARAGAKVLLIEEDPVVGGATTDFWVDAFCGGPRTGIIKEVEDILKTKYSLSTKGEGSFFLPCGFLKAFAFLLHKERRPPAGGEHRHEHKMLRSKHLCPLHCCFLPCAEHTLPSCSSCTSRRKTLRYPRKTAKNRQSLEGK